MATLGLVGRQRVGIHRRRHLLGAVQALGCTIAGTRRIRICRSARYPIPGVVREFIGTGVAGRWARSHSDRARHR